VKDSDSVAVLDAAGRLRILEAESMIGSGSIAADGLILSIGRIPAEGLRKVEG
jgi:hypothetical protein